MKARSTAILKIHGSEVCINIASNHQKTESNLNYSTFKPSSNHCSQSELRFCAQLTNSIFEIISQVK